MENFLEEKIEKGERVSPILPENIKNYLIPMAYQYKEIY